MNDAAMRAQERAEGAPRLIDLLRTGRVTIRNVKRMAVCGNKEAQTILGFTRKPKVKFFHVLRVMVVDCPERVDVLRKMQKPWTGKRTKHCLKMPNYSTKWLGHQFRFMLVHGFCRLLYVGNDGGSSCHIPPGHWWLGRELAKMGRSL